MNEALVANWNNRVGADDLVYHLGDVAFTRDTGKLKHVLSRLNGEKHLVLGNHDFRMIDVLRPYFASINQMLHVEVPDLMALHGKRSITLCHFPMKRWHKSHYGAWHLYGHCHGSLPESGDELCCDVGVDCRGFAPVSFEEIAAIMAQRRFEPIRNRNGG